MIETDGVRSFLPLISVAFLYLTCISYALSAAVPEFAFIILLLSR